jgi:hypothetical protein
MNIMPTHIWITIKYGRHELFLKSTMFNPLDTFVYLTIYYYIKSQCEIQYQILNNNGEHWWKLSPLDYRWCCGRSGPAFVMISQHAFTAMCLCYLSINSFLWFFFYGSYFIILLMIRKMSNCVLHVHVPELKKKGIKIKECTCICIHI